MIASVESESSSQEELTSRMKELGRLVLAVRHELVDSFGRPGCIEGVATLIEVARTLKVGRLQPLTVHVDICNPTLVERVGDFNAPDVAARIKRWMSEEGSFRVGLGMGKRDANEWEGHLVAVATHPDPQKRIVLDPTIEQVNQPAHNIVIPALAFPVAAAHLQGKSGFQLPVVNGCMILGMAFPADRSYEQTPAWRDRRLHAVLRDRVLERLR